MTERAKYLIAQFAIPLLVLAASWGVLQYKVDKKEDASDHAADVQDLRNQQNKTYDLLLDVACRQEPSDRRCK